jgi:hypothetical protein
MASTEAAPPFEPFQSKVVSYDDAPDECTIYPKHVRDDREMTAWITARGDSFCSVQSRR